jgi:hypothetical protein
MDVCGSSGAGVRNASRHRAAFCPYTAAVPLATRDSSSGNRLRTWQRTSCQATLHNCTFCARRLSYSYHLGRHSYSAFGVGADAPLANRSSTCGNCRLVHDHPDLRGDESDPAGGDGAAAAQGLIAGRVVSVTEPGCVSDLVTFSSCGFWGWLWSGPLRFAPFARR